VKWSAKSAQPARSNDAFRSRRRSVVERRCCVFVTGADPYPSACGLHIAWKALSNTIADGIYLMALSSVWSSCFHFRGLGTTPANPRPAASFDAASERA